MDIYDKNQNLVLSTPINEGSVIHYDLMGEHYIQLNFTLSEPIIFNLGMYVVYEGKRFEVTEVQKPTLNTNTFGYEYRLKLDAYYRKWKNKIFKYTPENSSSETEWSLTASISVHASVILRNLASIGYTYNGTAFSVSVDQSVTSASKFIQYSNTNILDALTAIAETFECEWWVTDNIIHFGRCEYGDAVNIEIGVNAQSMVRSESKNDYYTRLFVFGSERNIPPNYRSSNTVVNGVVQKRLMLPVATPYIDAEENQSQEESVEGVVIFDDIYPRTDCTITSVSTYTDTVDNEDGTTTTQTFYRIKENDFNFSKDYILSGEELRIVFQSGLLNGMDFAVSFNPLGEPEKDENDNWNPDAQLFEIIVNGDYGRDLPDTVLYPAVGDKFVLYGWDTTQIEALGLIASAEQELYQRGLSYIQKTKIDPSTYTVTIMSDNAFGREEDGVIIVNQLILDMGDRVNLINAGFFQNGRISRVIGYELKLDLPYDNPQYTVGEVAAYSRIGELESQVNSIIYNGVEYNYSSGTGVYIIGSKDKALATDRNVYSARMSDLRFLRKDVDDIARGLITSLKGFQVGANFISGLLGEGGIYRMEADGKSYIEIDKLYVRMKAYFDEIEVRRYIHSGGNRIASKTGNKISKVVYYDSQGNVTENAAAAAYYRCYFRLTDDDGNSITNDWQVGDLARCQEFNNNSGTHSYWRAVISVGSVADADGLGYIDLSNDRYETFEHGGETYIIYGYDRSIHDTPEEGDDVIQLGHVWDKDRQGAIVEYSGGENSPSYQMLQGIDNYDLTNKTIINFGFDSSTGKAYMNVYGDTYIGDRKTVDQQGNIIYPNSYIEFDSSTHQVTIKADLKVTNPTTGSGDVNLLDWIECNYTSVSDLKSNIELDFSDKQKEYNYYYRNNNSTVDEILLIESHYPEGEEKPFTYLYELMEIAYGSANSGYVKAKNDLISAIDSAKQDGEISPAEYTNISSKYTSYKSARNTLIDTINDVSDFILSYNYQGITDLDYLKAALREDTEIRGGLIQSSLLSLGYHEVTTGVYKTTAGLNGVYDATKVGNGIAAWYGGKMADIEYPYVAVVNPTGNPKTLGYYEYNTTTHVYTPTNDTSVVSGKTYYQTESTTDYAKSLFRMDGTGYVASGNISWNSLGQVTLKNLYTDTGESIDQLLALFSIGGTIPTDPYITPAYPFSDLSIRISSGNVVSLKDFIQSYENLFIPHYTYTAVASPSGNPSSLGYYEYNSTTQRYYPSTDTAIQSGTTYYTRTLTSIEATVDFYSDGQVSAFGLGTGGGGGGTNLGAVWQSLSHNTDAYQDIQIHAGHLSNYYTKSEANSLFAQSANYYTKTESDARYATQSSMSGLFTSMVNSGNNLSLTIGGTTKTLEVGYATSSGGVGSFKTFNFTKANNGGYPTFLLVSDVTDWYGRTSSTNSTNTIFGLIGDFIGKRSGNMTPTYKQSVVATVSYYNIYRKLSANGERVLPYVISYDSKYYIALKLTGSNYTGYFFGYANELMSEFIQLNFTSATAIPTGVTVIYEPSGMDYYGTASSANLANQLSTARTLWGQSFDGSANVSGDMTGVGTLTASGLITANGNVSTASYIIIGNYKLTSTNDGLSVTRTDNTNANLYATGEVTAFGIGTSSSGGLDIDAMWAELKTASSSPLKQIDQSHLTTALSDYTKTANLATVAISGSYQDLTNKPTIPAAQVQTDWNATTGMAAILNKPNNLVTTTSLNSTLQNYAQTSQLANYLPLEGGTMTGTINSRSIIPTSNNARDLGSTDYYFRNVYAYKYYLPNSCHIDQSSGVLCLRIGGSANLAVDTTSVRRGGSSSADISLGTSSVRWKNIYSVGGNFSGDVTMASTLNVTGLITALGNIKTTDYIEIGDYRIVADSTNTALKVMHKNGSTDVNFYATGEVTAFGVGSSGTGGLNLAAMWENLGSDTGTYGQSQINISHLTTALSGYATTSSLSAYVQRAELNTTLNDYATKIWVEGKGYLTSETDPIFTASAAYSISSGDITNWNNKSDFSGAYSDLTGKPTNVSSFTNDAGYVTSTSLSSTLNNYVKSITISNAKLTYKKGDNTNTEIDIAASLGLYNKNDKNINTITAERVTYSRVGSGDFGSLPANNGYNAVISISRYSTANHSSQLGFTDDGYFYYRHFTGAADTTTAWSKIAFAGSPNNYAMIPYTIGSWSKLVNVNSYGNVLLFIRLSQSNQNASYVFSITTASAKARCYQLSSGNYANNSNFSIRVTRSTSTNFDVEIKSDYSYNSATSANAYVSWICNGSTSISNSPYYKTSPTVTPYTEATAGSGTSTAAEFTTVTTADIVNATIYSPNLHLTAAEGTAPMTVSSTTMVANLQAEFAAKLKTARTLWGNLFDGSADLTGLIEADNGIKIGNAYLWWDSTNSCLVVSGASNGTPSKSVVINFAASGEISAMQTS